MFVCVHVFVSVYVCAYVYVSVSMPVSVPMSVSLSMSVSVSMCLCLCLFPLIEVTFYWTLSNKSSLLCSFKFPAVSNKGSLFENQTQMHCKSNGLTFPHIVCAYSVTYRVLLIWRPAAFGYAWLRRYWNVGNIYSKFPTSLQWRYLSYVTFHNANLYIPL